MRYVTLRYIMYYDFIIAFSVDALSIRTHCPPAIYIQRGRGENPSWKLLAMYSLFCSLAAVNSSISSLCYLILTPSNALQRIAFAFGRSRYKFSPLLAHYKIFARNPLASFGCLIPLHVQYNLISFFFTPTQRHSTIRLQQYFVAVSVLLCYFHDAFLFTFLCTMLLFHI